MVAYCTSPLDNFHTDYVSKNITPENFHLTLRQMGPQCFQKFLKLQTHEMAADPTNLTSFNKSNSIPSTKIDF